MAADFSVCHSGQRGPMNAEPIGAPRPRGGGTPYSVSKAVRCNDLRRQRGAKVVMRETLTRRVVSAKELGASCKPFRKSLRENAFPFLLIMFSIVRFSRLIACKTARVNFRSELCGLG
jgi:hypothetical protein